MATTLRRAAASLLASTLGSGCSWIFMTRPPASVPEPSVPIECTTSRAAPVLDTVCAGYFVVNGIVWAAAKSCSSASPGEKCYSSSDKSTGIAVSAGLATLCGISAVSGYGYAGRCREVRASQALCISGNEAACLQLTSRPSPSPGPSPAPAPSSPGTAAPPPPPPGAPAGPAPPIGGCTKDTDCKGERICEKGQCTEPRPRGELPGR